MFATTFALMLRSLDIPCRVVTGFHGGCLDQRTGAYVFAERDRHAWTEVYFADRGWVTIDPTPADALPRPNTMADSGFADMIPSFAFLGEPRLGDESTISPDAPRRRARRPWLGFYLAATLAAIFVIGRLLTKTTPRSIASPRRPPATPTFFDAFCRHFARHGCPRHPAQTPREYLAALKRQGFAGELLDDMIAYVCRTRYAGASPEPEREAEFLAALNHP